MTRCFDEKNRGFNKITVVNINFYLAHLQPANHLNKNIPTQ